MFPCSTETRIENNQLFKVINFRRLIHTGSAKASRGQGTNARKVNSGRVYYAYNTY